MHRKPEIFIFMNKKTFLILCVVAVVVVGGFVLSKFTNWPVDISKTEGDIGKAARFSREAEGEKITNLEELLKADSSYKEGLVMAYAIMQARAEQFASLVNMSNQVAGGISEYASLIEDMNKVNSMVSNVNAQLTEAGKNLDEVLGGKECPELTQSTINASLAYTQLQKQNTLANRFIDTTDKYLANAKGNDQLKLVRDQWVDYQKMTAALEDNKESAKALEDKGYLLTSEKAEAALGAFADATQKVMFLNTMLCNKMNMNTNLSGRVTGRVTGNSEKLGWWFFNSQNLNAIISNSALMSQAGAAMNNNVKLGSQINGIINQTALGRGPR